MCYDSFVQRKSKSTSAREGRKIGLTSAIAIVAHAGGSAYKMCNNEI